MGQRQRLGGIDGSASPSAPLLHPPQGPLPIPLGSTDSPSVSSRVEPERARMLPLARAWEAAQHLLQPAPDHVRLAMLRELQAASTLQRTDVPPPLRATTPIDLYVVDLDHFLLSAVVFYDFSTQPGLAGSTAAAPSSATANVEKRAGGSLSNLPLAAALIAVLRRSIILTEELGKRRRHHNNNG